jgi:hypothetical protein
MGNQQVGVPTTDIRMYLQDIPNFVFQKKVSRTLARPGDSPPACSPHQFFTVACVFVVVGVPGARAPADSPRLVTTHKHQQLASPPSPKRACTACALPLKHNDIHTTRDTTQHP